MNLPFLKRFNKKVLPSYYLVLILRDEKAEAVVFEETEGLAKVVGQKEQHFSSSIDKISENELLEVLDLAISEAEYSLPENVQTQKTIFGVKETWTSQEQIKKEYLAKLKRACEKLGLIPIGFLVISQAIAHLLEKEEGVPVSAILVEVNKKNTTVTLLRAGKNIETKSSEIHESIPFTVDTLLKHFSSSEILPSRIIIFNGKEDFSQDFISHAWSKSLPFLHLPQVTNLPFGFDIKAVLAGAASQMGFDILENNLPQEFSTAEITSEEETPSTEGEENLETQKIEEPLEAEDFGFAKDIDVAKTEIKKPQKEEESIDLLNEKIVKQNFEEINPIEINQNPKVEKKTNPILNTVKNIATVILAMIFAFIQKINFKKFRLSTPKGKFGIIGLTILILLAGSIICYHLFLKAVVTIEITPQFSEQSKDVLFSTSKPTNTSENIIQGEFATISEEGSVSTPATGKKDVGTAAKGSVTIFNSLSQNKTLAEGTIITSSNGLKFTLDSTITIKAVASHSADETVSPEKLTANVTAYQLGKESNLPSGTKFSVESYDTSDIVAKNDSPFSGGTKKEVTVISKADVSKLEQDLVKNLESKAKEDLQNKIGVNKILLSSFISSSLGQETFNAKVGSEADQLTLNASVEYQGLIYNKEDVVNYFKTFLSKNISSNQEIDFNNIKITALDIKIAKNNDVNTKLNIKALLLPKIDEKSIIKQLKGKSFKESEDFLYKNPQVENVIIKSSPNFPLLPKNLPIMEKNITISIKING